MFYISTICNSYVLANILHIIREALKLIQIIGPILTIIALAISFIKATINPNDSNKINKQIYNSILATVILFFIPALINLTMHVLATVEATSEFDLATCWVESENIYKESQNNAANYKGPSNNSNSSSTNTSTSSTTGSKTSVSKKAIKKIKTKAKTTTNTKKETPINGKKYKLTNDQIKYLAAICKREQGSESGMRGEAHLIANRYELYGKTKYKSVTDYVKNSGWFGTSSASPTNDKTAINVVKSVFVQGNRTVPIYVDEHDCWFCNNRNTCKNGNKGDICSITGGTSKSYITNRSNYKKGKTKINNVYGSKYTFYYFPAATSDPFGYTDTAYQKARNLISNR